MFVQFDFGEVQQLRGTPTVIEEIVLKAERGDTPTDQRLAIPYED